MLVKELIVARRRLILCALLVVAAAFFDARNALADLQHYRMQTPEVVFDRLRDLTMRWFTGIGPYVLSLVAAILGGELIGGEVSKGTIGFLLSRPISRDRILLTKYLSSAAALLGLTILGSLIPSVTLRLAGFLPPLAEVLRATLYLWCIELSVLALALALSAVFKDAIGPFLFTLLGIYLFRTLDTWGVWVFMGYDPWRLPYSASYLTYAIGNRWVVWYATVLTAAGLLLCTALLLFRRRAF